MGQYFQSVSNWFISVFRQFSMIGFNDVIDIILVSFLFYYIYKFIKDRRAGKLAGGILLFSAILLFAEIFEFQVLKYIFGNIFQIGLLAIVIIFQPELRAALEKMGGESLRSITNIKTKNTNAEIELGIEELCTAVFELSASKTGALIVLENATKLGDIVKTGVVINSDMSSSLLKNIFFNKAPLHDGAVIVRDMRILAAGCFLPLTENTELSKDLGTRHRAAIGMSEASDSKIIVVSEETGVVSLAHNGKIRRRYTYETLKNELTSFLKPQRIELPSKDKKNRNRSTEVK